MKGTRWLVVSVLVVALWLFMAPGVALSQGSTWAGESLARTVESAMWKVGGLLANAAFQLRDAGYDSDIFYGYFGVAVPDVIFSASAPVQLLIPLNKNIVLDFYECPRYDFYLRTESERAWNNTFRGQAHLAFSKAYFRLGGELADNRVRLSQELYVNIREKTNSVDTFFLWQASRALSFALLFDREKFDYGDVEYSGASLAETLNRTVDSLEFVSFSQSNTRMRFFVDGQYASYVFSAPESQIKNTRSYALFGGFVSVIQEETPSHVGRIDGSARLGYMNFDVLAAGQPDGSGLVGDVDLSVGIFRFTNARAFYSRGFEFSIYSGATFFVQANYGIGISRLLSRRATLSYDLVFGQSSYPITAADQGALYEVLYRFTSHRILLSLNLARDLTVSLSGTIGRRVTSETGQVWNRYLVGVGLDFGRPVGPVSGPIGGLLRSSPGFGN